MGRIRMCKVVGLAIRSVYIMYCLRNKGYLNLNVSWGDSTLIIIGVFFCCIIENIEWNGPGIGMSHDVSF